MTAVPSNFTDERLKSDVVERISRCQGETLGGEKERGDEEEEGNKSDGRREEFRLLHQYLESGTINVILWRGRRNGDENSTMMFLLCNFRTALPRYRCSSSPGRRYISAPI